MRVLDGEPRQLDDAHAADAHRAALGLEPLAATGVAGLVREVAHVIAPHRLGARRLHPAVELVHDALELDPPGAGVRRGLRAEEDDVAVVLGQLRPGQVEVDLERAGEVLDELEGPPLAALHPARPRLDRALADRERRVGDDEVGVHLGARTEALAVGARAERRVEREALRRELAEAEAAGVAGVQLGEEAIVLLVLLGVARPDLLLLVGVRDDERALALAQRRLDRVGQPGADPLLHDEAIHHELDVVLQLLVEHEPLGQLVDHPVHAHAREAALREVDDELPVLALAVLDERGEQEDAGVLGVLEDRLHDLLRRLLAHRTPARGAVLQAHGGVQHAQVVVDLGDRADGRARVVGGSLLLDGDRGRKPADRVVLGLLHLPEELARVGREGLDVAALPLGVEGVERERGLPRPGDAGEHHQLLLRDLEGDRLEVVLARALDGDELGLAHVARCLTERGPLGQPRRPGEVAPRHVAIDAPRSWTGPGARASGGRAAAFPRAGRWW